jgi:molecular chaperone DnaK (HSP70)
MTRPLVDKTLRPIKKTLRDAGLSPEDVKGVVMVGGATRMPHVQKAVGEFFGQTRSPTSTPTPWSPSAPRCRPTCWPATGPPTKNGCSST